ncbi:AraC family transcriptional regulator [Paenibacillus sp.]|uniref:AraC family transcriptional regulator n=1 Tax=Paenibacillus sp. TaxID=58172 RepID=UPI002D3206B9|nr:AraC family transcriptional regulator [Paenibacillus sp.]HZG56299.1 AraC family transcriptional regulator [Paenibacillus sp.]
MPIPISCVTGVYPGTVVYPPGGTFGPRVQPDIQFVLLHTGRMRVDIDGEALDVSPGEVAMLLPGRTETFAFAPDRTSWHRWIAVSVDALPEGALRTLESLPRTLPLTEDFNRLTDLLLSLKAKDMLGVGDVGAAFGAAAVRLYAATAAAAPAAAVHESVAAAKEAIHRRFGEDLNLRELAAAAGVSPEHLVRLFRAHEKLTPMKYVWHYRVLAAVDMLVHTGLPVGEIAARCGFKTSYHFARVVKAHTGKTPSAIRAERWRGEEELV